MEFSTHTQDHVMIVTVEAERIDASVAIAFKDKMREQMGGNAAQYVLDLHKVMFIDSSGLGSIVAAMKLVPQGGKMDLAGLTPAVDKVFRMTRMDSIFTIHGSAQDALAKSA
ncbi:Anti-sigma-B factor antagonist [Pelagimonas phthalicica]|uniref:Anti-sigma factor antagonist n=1 Tax=Pelagimonas phthalicica TaxID=1037362 RepID=A0A238J9Y8_9RHOB|nr:MULTISPECIES: STAS domain-containing protein [Roseobacteraceae]MBO9466378.1 STAS domain-containing protein [Tropicibacter sp. R15_0]TDS94447.1 anti-sigma B factor antagonist [Pelagimonas phthalicica]SMX27024.1 Anti-sigma-B factor antagonist [Pelagimonas phthalicica]